MDLTICCADIGSVEQGTFGWALRDLPGPLLEVPGHASITELADEIATRLANGRSVALGFECPLFVPVRDVPEKLTSARKGEGSRAWSAGADAARSQRG